ncbi:hypothetical protein V8E53_000221 [Lactarius tabidus]
MCDLWGHAQGLQPPQCREGIKLKSNWRGTKAGNSEGPPPLPDSSGDDDDLYVAATNLNNHLTSPHTALPPRTILLQFSGHRDPRSMSKFAADNRALEGAVVRWGCCCLVKRRRLFALAWRRQRYVLAYPQVKFPHVVQKLDCPGTQSLCQQRRARSRRLRSD